MSSTQRAVNACSWTSSSSCLSRRPQISRIAWRTSLLPLLLPLISIAAAIVLAPRWNVLDPVDASIIEHWLPFAAALAAGVTVAASAHLDAARHRSFVALVALLTPALIAVLVLAFIAPGESHIRLGWAYLAFVGVEVPE